MSRPLVSIVMPCYNAAAWVKSAVESALGQSWTNLEVIVVNDGSTDQSLRILQSISDSRLRVLDQRNAGQCAAANAGLREARGDFVKFFDADDLLSPDHVERQVTRLLTEPAGRIAYSEWARFEGDPVTANFIPRAGWHDAAPADWLTEIWRDAQPMMQCGQFLLPRALIEKTGGWDERLSLINDFEFFSRLVTASEGVVFTPGARLYYRSNLSQSLSGRRDFRAWESAVSSLLLGTGHLLRIEDSPRTRASCAAVIQATIYDMYPAAPQLIQKLEARVAELGGTALRAQGGKGFLLAQRLLGWKAARHLQIAAGKHPGA